MRVAYAMSAYIPIYGTAICIHSQGLTSFSIFDHSFPFLRCAPNPPHSCFV